MPGLYTWGVGARARGLGIGGALVLGLGVPATAAAAEVASSVVVAPPLRAVLVRGNSALPPSRLQAAVAHLVGRPADPALLDVLRTTVADTFDAAGLGLVAVDPPLLYEGVAVVHVQSLVLGRVQARSEDATEVVDGELQATLPALRAGFSPDLRALDQQLRLANLQPHRRWSIDFREGGAAGSAPLAAAQHPSTEAQASAFDSQPGQTVATAQDRPPAATPPLRPGTRGSAASTVDADVLISGGGPWYGRLFVDNDGQDATGRERARLQFGHGDALGPGRALELTLLTALRKPSAQHQVALRYQHPLPAWGSLVTVEASRSVSRPGLVQNFFDVSGDSRSLNLSLRHLLPRQGALEPYVEAGLERSVYDDVVGFFGVNLGSKVGTAPLSLALGATWQGRGTSAFGQLRLRHDTGWGAWSGRADYGAARAGAAPRWNALDMAAEVRRAMDAGGEFVARVQAQWSGDPLIAPQQFRVGGTNMLRGLKEGELSGDKGFAVALEYWWRLPAQHRLGLLADAGAVRRNQPAVGDVGRASAASAGVGWQWQPLPALQLQASVARLLRVHHLPQRDSGDTRVHVALDWSF